MNHEEQIVNINDIVVGDRLFVRGNNLNDQVVMPILIRQPSHVIDKDENSIQLQHNLTIHLNPGVEGDRQFYINRVQPPGQYFVNIFRQVVQQPVNNQVPPIGGRKKLSKAKSKKVKSKKVKSKKAKSKKAKSKKVKSN